MGYTMTNERLTLRQLWSPKGNEVRMWVREDTSDLGIALSTFAWAPDKEAPDEYRLRKLSLSGWALDVGAHIGSVTIALLADNPDLRVTAIEPLGENIQMIWKNLAENGWIERCIPVQGAVGATSVDYDYPGGEGSFERTNRFVGHLQQLTPTAQSVAEVAQIDLEALDPYVFAKWDCEGCEWSGLQYVRAPIIVGEWHGDPGIPGLSERLPGYQIEATNSGAAGNFYASRLPE